MKQCSDYQFTETNLKMSVPRKVCLAADDRLVWECPGSPPQADWHTPAWAGSDSAGLQCTPSHWQSCTLSCNWAGGHWVIQWSPVLRGKRQLTGHSMPCLVLQDFSWTVLQTLLLTESQLSSLELLQMTSLTEKHCWCLVTSSLVWHTCSGTSSQWRSGRVRQSSSVRGEQWGRDTGGPHTFSSLTSHSCSVTVTLRASHSATSMSPHTSMLVSRHWVVSTSTHCSSVWVEHSGWEMVRQRSPPGWHSVSHCSSNTVLATHMRLQRVLSLLTCSRSQWRSSWRSCRWARGGIEPPERPWGWRGLRGQRRPAEPAEEVSEDHQTAGHLLWLPAESWRAAHWAVRGHTHTFILQTKLARHFSLTEMSRTFVLGSWNLIHHRSQQDFTKNWLL